MHEFQQDSDSRTKAKQDDNTTATHHIRASDHPESMQSGAIRAARLAQSLTVGLGRPLRPIFYRSRAAGVGPPRLPISSSLWTADLQHQVRLTIFQQVERTIHGHAGCSCLHSGFPRSNMRFERAVKLHIREDERSETNRFHLKRWPWRR